MSRLYPVHLIAIITATICSAAVAVPIDEWPQQNQMDTKKFEKRFIELFESGPEELAGILEAEVECDLPEELARKLSNTTEEVQEGMMGTSEYITDIDVDIDIQSLEVFSTAQGCAALKNVTPELVSLGHIQLYRVPDSFNTSFRTVVDYEQTMTMAMEIMGNSSESVTETEQVVETIYNRPLQRVHPDYPIEIIVISMSDVFQAPFYSIIFSKTGSKGGETDTITLNRMAMLDKVSNTLAFIGKNKQGQTTQNTYGTAMKMLMIDGKMHGIFSMENYLYKTDKTADPLSVSCYDMGEKINVFKVTGDSSCESVSDDLIGAAGVYVDAMYQLQLSIQDTSVVKTVRLDRARHASVKKEKQQAEIFKQLRASAKCDLANDNWAYTGDQCKQGLAHGKGKATDKQGLEFIGMFEAGQRVKGEIHQNGEMIFSGSLVDDKPDGSAICFHEGEYEECRFYKGKRIDTLYKIRKENAKMQEKMAQMQSRSQPVTQTSSGGKDVGDYAMDALKREGASRAASFIFDSLF